MVVRRGVFTYVGVWQTIFRRQGCSNYSSQWTANNSAELQTRSLVLAVSCGLDCVGSTFRFMVIFVCKCVCVHVWGGVCWVCRVHN